MTEYFEQCVFRSNLKVSQILWLVPSFKKHCTKERQKLIKPPTLWGPTLESDLSILSVILAFNLRLAHLSFPWLIPKPEDFSTNASGTNPGKTGEKYPDRSQMHLLCRRRYCHVPEVTGTLLRSMFPRRGGALREQPQRDMIFGAFLEWHSSNMIQSSPWNLIYELELGDSLLRMDPRISILRVDDFVGFGPFQILIPRREKKRASIKQFDGSFAKGLPRRKGLFWPTSQHICMITYHHNQAKSKVTKCLLTLPMHCRYALAATFTPY